MADTMEIARAVAARIGGGAVATMLPEYTLRDVKEAARVVVVPAGVEHRRLARGIREDSHAVHVGVLRKATEDELEGLVAHVEDLALRLLRTEACGARCVKAVHAPLYDPAHMRERRQFTGVVELTFLEVVREGGGRV